MSEDTTNRFRAIIPNAIPWRERAHTDTLVEALVRQGASDAEAIDVLAADRERMRVEIFRLLQFQSPPSIVIDSPTAVAAAIVTEREACRKLAVDTGNGFADVGAMASATACESVANAIAARSRR